MRCEETHYTDARGRKRKRKTVRTRALGSGELGGTQRRWTPSERELVVALHLKMGKPEFGRVANELQRLHPTMFGPGSPGKPQGISRQDVRSIIQRHDKEEITDMRGRPSSLPAFVIAIAVTAMTAVVSARATIVSAPMLQPIVVAVIIAEGFTSLLNEARREHYSLVGKSRRGVFCCGLDFIRGIMHENHWRCVRPQADTHKLPANWEELTWLFTLRLAYFVLVHEIPRSLVINADQTGIMFLQVKGRTWIPEAMAKAGDKSIQGHGDKRQFTLCASSSAAGDVLKHQVVVQGKGKRSLPNTADYLLSTNGRNSKGYMTVCFILRMLTAFSHIGSFCCTSNHWSDDVTSKAYIKDIAVPYFQAKIAELRKQDPTSCKPFGDQMCVVIVDCWWGWMDAGFRAWVKERYPWIRLLYVPAGCTSKAQPMDAGIIAKIKGWLRKMYGWWVCQLTTSQLKSGVKPEDIKVPADVPTCKVNLFMWLSQIVEKLNADKSGIVHCWESTGLLRAWERSVQVEAFSKASQIFPNFVAASVVVVEDSSAQVDEEAFHEGEAFMQTAKAEEWLEWIDWDKLEEQAGGSSGA